MVGIESLLQIEPAGPQLSLQLIGCSEDFRLKAVGSSTIDIEFNVIRVKAVFRGALEIVNSRLINLGVGLHVPDFAGQDQVIEKGKNWELFDHRRYVSMAGIG